MTSADDGVESMTMSRRQMREQHPELFWARDRTDAAAPATSAVIEFVPGHLEGSPARETAPTPHVAQAQPAPAAAPIAPSVTAVDVIEPHPFEQRFAPAIAEASAAASASFSEPAPQLAHESEPEPQAEAAPELAPAPQPEAALESAPESTPESFTEPAHESVAELSTPPEQSAAESDLVAFAELFDGPAIEEAPEDSPEVPEHSDVAAMNTPLVTPEVDDSPAEPTQTVDADVAPIATALDEAPRDSPNADLPPFFPAPPVSAALGSAALGIPPVTPRQAPEFVPAPADAGLTAAPADGASFATPSLPTPAWAAPQPLPAGPASEAPFPAARIPAPALAAASTPAPSAAPFSAAAFSAAPPAAPPAAPFSAAPSAAPFAAAPFAGPAFAAPAQGPGLAEKPTVATSAAQPFSLDLPPAPALTAVRPVAVPDLSGWIKPGPEHGRTASVWLLVFMPILQVAAFIGLLLVNPAARELTPTANITSALLAFMGWIVLAAMLAWLLGTLAVLWMGFRDRAALRALGHERTASPWWTLLSPVVYLAIRTNHVHKATGGGSWPLTVWVILYVLPAVVFTVVQIVVAVTRSS
ncbi:hypothetical protein [Salinibacterium sp. ZJ450]|uniref:hypothetical protein n=1 Tax=Salinibacterium sp. ZJ450 TaxID=2708338 RepID=UPI00142183C5|nr:hypothetical protein [Salinibacterium sp. ZJ450]